jgi:hypothetical protein
MFAEPNQQSLVIFILNLLFYGHLETNEERTQWMKYMHGMNRISLIMFLVAVLVIICKLVIFPLFRK